MAQVAGNRLVLKSPSAGGTSLLLVDVFASRLATLPNALIPALDAPLPDGTLAPSLRSQVEALGIKLSPEAALLVQAPGSRWLLSDAGRAYPVKNENGQVTVYSRALAEPALGFAVPVPAMAPPAADAAPSAFRDAGGDIWLFWNARRSRAWKVWYNRCDTAVPAWGSAKVLTTGSRADREPFALFDPAGAGRLWVFWSRKKAGGRWNVFYRTTAKLEFDNLNDADWTETELTAVPADYDNRDPAGIVQPAGGVDLYFASNRSDGWHVWTKTITTAGQGADTRLTTGAFSHRHPLVLRVGVQPKRLFHRTNRGQVYVSPLYPAAQTADDRYSGSTTVDTRNGAKIGQRRSLQDIQRYTHETRKGEEDWYARDTVGIYLAPDVLSQALVVRRRNQIESTLRSFLPIQVRTVFVLDQVIPEFFYAYDDPSLPKPTFIGEQMTDSLLGEVFRETGDAYSDTGDFQWLRTWDGTHSEPTLPDLGTAPPNLSFRLPIIGVGEKEPGG